MNATGILPARFHWWMTANYLKSETARTITESGRTVEEVADAIADIVRSRVPNLS